jgi:transcriptional antiterminator
VDHEPIGETTGYIARLSKSDTAKRLGVTRKTLYRHIAQGRIIVESDGMIDTTELLARGYTLNGDREGQGNKSIQVDTEPYERLIEVLTSERDRLRRDLDIATQEKAILLDMIRTLSLPPARIGPLARFREWFWRR